MDYATSSSSYGNFQPFKALQSPPYSPPPQKDNSSHMGRMQANHLRNSLDTIETPLAKKGLLVLN